MNQNLFVYFTFMNWSEGLLPNMGNGACKFGCWNGASPCCQRARAKCFSDKPWFSSQRMCKGKGFTTCPADLGRIWILWPSTQRVDFLEVGFFTWEGHKLRIHYTVEWWLDFPQGAVQAPFRQCDIMISVLALTPCPISSRGISISNMTFLYAGCTRLFFRLPRGQHLRSLPRGRQRRSCTKQYQRRILMCAAY